MEIVFLISYDRIEQFRGEKSEFCDLCVYATARAQRGMKEGLDWWTHDFNQHIFNSYMVLYTYKFRAILAYSGLQSEGRCRTPIQCSLILMAAPADVHLKNEILPSIVRNLAGWLDRDSRGCEDWKYIYNNNSSDYNSNRREQNHV